MLVPSTAPFLGLYPLNLAQWSIFFELVANAVHAAVLRKLSLRALAAVAAVSAMALIVCQQHYGSMDMGAGIETFAGGLARVFFSYTVGMILWRLWCTNRLPQVKGGWTVAPVILLAYLCITASKTSVAGQIVDLVAVLFLFPAIAMVSLAGIKFPRVNEFCALAGNLSYPIYLLQLPVFWLCRKALHGYGNDVVTVATLLVTIPASLAAFYYYDKPIRAWIGGRLKMRSQSLAASAP